MKGHFKNCKRPGFCYCEIKGFTLVGCIGLCLFSLELWGGHVSHSLSLLSDAGHVLTDVGANVVSIAVALLVKKYHRHEKNVRVAGGFFHSLLFAVIATSVFWGVYDRWHEIHHLNLKIVIALGFAGAVINFAQHALLHRYSGNEHTITHKAQARHLLTDMGLSLAVGIGGIVMHFTGYIIVDLVLSMGIGFIMIYFSLDLLLKSIRGEAWDPHHSCSHSHTQTPHHH